MCLKPIDMFRADSAKTTCAMTCRSQRFAALPLLVPDRRDYIDAADIRNVCRRSGVRIGTIDALLGQLCIRHELTLLTTDADFTLAARHCPLRVWSPTR